MNVKKVGEKYRCNVCGNEVVVTKVGGGELVCCGKPMEQISDKAHKDALIDPDPPRFISGDPEIDEEQIEQME